jgi:hypothetical protein
VGQSIPSKTTWGVPLDRNPLLAPGLQWLSRWLEDGHYSAHAREAILAYAGLHGTVTGAPMLEASDEEGASEAFVTGLKDVAYDDAGWDCDTSVLFCTDMLAEGNCPWPLPLDCDAGCEDVPILEPLFDVEDLCPACRSPHVVVEAGRCQCATCWARWGREAGPE